MKKVIFWGLFFIFATVEAQYEALFNGKQEFSVDPIGSYFNVTPRNPATKILLSSISTENINGKLIRVRRLGAFSAGVWWPDEYTSMIVVFIDQNDQQIEAGARTTASTVDTTNQFGADVPYDLNLGGGSISEGNYYLLDVPENAVAMLVTPQDDPHGNSDANGDYKIEINPSLIENADIYQVVKNPMLFSPGIHVDLVAGKNADIVVKTLRNVNVEGSYIEWKNVAGTVTEYFSLKPGQTHSTYNGEVYFNIDTVPTAASFQGGYTSPKVYLKGRNFSSVIVDLDEVILNTRIRKTKPIRLGFLPIDGCLQATCFTKASSTDVTEMAERSGKIIRTMYPVANSEITYDYFENGILLPVMYNKTRGFGTAIDDVITLEKRRRKYTPKYIDFLVGVGGSNYFSSRGEAGTFGTVGGEIPSVDDAQANNYKSRSLTVARDYYFSAAHELGHAMSLNHFCHDPSADCTPQDTLDGYSNFSDLSSWDISRAKVGDRSPLMTVGTSYPGFTNPNVSAKDKWISRKEYLQLFKANLYSYYKNSRELKVSSVDQKSLRIFGSVKDNIFIASHFYFQPLGSAVIENPLTGDHQVEVLDRNGDIIYSEFVNSYLPSSEAVVTGLKYLGFDLQVSKDATYVKIYKIVGPDKSLVAHVSVATALVEDQLKYIMPGSVAGDLGAVTTQISSMLDSIDASIKCKSFVGAQYKMMNNLLPYVNSQISSDTVTDQLAVNAKQLKTSILESLLRIKNAVDGTETYNPFISACLSNTSSGFLKKSKISVTFLKPSIPKNYKYTLKLYLDNLIVTPVEQGSDFVFESGIIANGTHKWKVETFIVNTAAFENLSNALRVTEKELVYNEKLLETETNSVKIIEIEARILEANKRAEALKSDRSKLEKPLGNVQEFEFGV